MARKGAVGVGVAGAGAAAATATRAAMVAMNCILVVGWKDLDFEKSE